jgi:hypothetical protein
MMTIVTGLFVFGFAAMSLEAMGGRYGVLRHRCSNSGAPLRMFRARR